MFAAARRGPCLPKHGGVEKRIDPAEAFKDMISEHADKERYGYEPQTQGSGASKTPKEGAALK